MSSIGIDRNTGRLLAGFDHVRQSVQVIFGTHFGQRVQREEFGSNIPVMLGRENLTPAQQLRFFTAIILALRLWEPRLKDLRVYYPSDKNSPEGARQGKVGLRVTAKYMPNALQGDFTSDAVTIDL